MNPAYDEVISASDADRGALFAETAARLGTPVQNVEKDFWVCWTLDALHYHQLSPGINYRLDGAVGRSEISVYSHGLNRWQARYAQKKACREAG